VTALTGVPARLCIFARVPIPGRVKTRLAAELGHGVAFAAHVDLVEGALARLADVPGAVGELWLDDEPEALSIEWASRYRLAIRRQVGADLGERMHHALLDGLASGGRAVLVGTDCPPIDAAYVEAAVNALEGVDVVLGPASDGGYGLVALRRAAPDLFREIPWGTSAVLKRTLRAAEAAGIECALLPEIWDVDTPDDWRRYLEWRGRR
jgi:uncharacterized protein